MLSPTGAINKKCKGTWKKDRSGQLPVGILKAIRNSFLLASRLPGSQLTGVAATFPRCKEDSGDEFYIQADGNLERTFLKKHLKREVYHTGQVT
jgi:hypothetical protein